MMLCLLWSLKVKLLDFFHNCPLHEILILQVWRICTGKFGLGVQKEAGQRLIEFCQENALVTENILFQLHKRRLYTWTSPDGRHQNQIDYIFAAKDGEALNSQQKQDQELTVAQIMNSILPNSDLN